MECEKCYEFCARHETVVVKTRKQMRKQALLKNARGPSTVVNCMQSMFIMERTMLWPDSKTGRGKERQRDMHVVNTGPMQWRHVNRRVDMFVEPSWLEGTIFLCIVMHALRETEVLETIQEVQKYGSCPTLGLSVCVHTWNRASLAATDEQYTDDVYALEIYVISCPVDRNMILPELANAKSADIFDSILSTSVPPTLILAANDVYRLNMHEMRCLLRAICIYKSTNCCT
ncbi:hypothetical protein CBL_06106 [Carabus blaptoides fortunei]